MATVNVSSKPLNFFLQKENEGRPPATTNLQISNLFKPDFLGSVMAQELDRTSLVAQLMIQGNEFMSGGRTISWAEEEELYGMPVIRGNIITRAGNDFTFNAGAIVADVDDIDSNRPDTAQWLVEVGMNFWVADRLGVMNHGVVTAVSVDGLTMTAVPVGEGVSAWTVALVNLDMGFKGYNLKNCEFAPCIGYRNYMPVFENTFFKDSVCEEYCEETEIEQGTENYDLFELEGIGYVNVDARLSRKEKELMMRAEHQIAFGVRQTQLQATANNQERGSKGLLTYYADKMIKNQGMIETIDDLFLITEQLRANHIMKATLRATNAQMTKLAKLISPTSPYFFSPFQNNTNQMAVFGFKGFEVNGVQIVFQSWNALDNTSDNLAKKFHYIVIPDDKLSRVINGRRETVGYLNIVWFSGMGKTWKMLRDASDKEVGRGFEKVDITNKFSLAVFGVRKFIIGLA